MVELPVWLLAAGCYSDCDLDSLTGVAQLLIKAPGIVDGRQLHTQQPTRRSQREREDEHCSRTLKANLACVPWTHPRVVAAAAAACCLYSLT